MDHDRSRTMPQLSNAQLQGLAASNLDAGVVLDADWDDPYPDAPCWGFALFGGPGGHADNTPPTISTQAFVLNAAGLIVGLNPGFVQWVQQDIGGAAATAQAQALAANFQAAFIDLDDDAQQACSDALARLCAVAAGLTLSAANGTAPTSYSVVMASDHWYSWEHWALGLANNVGQPEYPAVQYCQRYAGGNPVKTRSRQVWGAHPILTRVYLTELLDGHVSYLEHAQGWPG
ncbi:hypothetical protein SAMN04487939_105166 [Lysobacter sp. yr284]|nr:hypothetical protein SAMN04487939_105166 [Lysobacter sp. yr284]